MENLSKMMHKMKGAFMPSKKEKATDPLQEKKREILKKYTK